MTNDEAVVYVVDDDKEMCDSVSDLLSSVGREVIAFYSGQAFLESFDASVLSCLVLDVRMPGMSGIDLLREMKRRNQSTPTIVVTAFGDIPMAVEAIKLGALDFIQKPYRAKTLVESVARCFAEGGIKHERHRYRERMAERLNRLTPREREIAVLVATGTPGKQIARELSISFNTVQNHRQQIMKKTETHSASELTLLILKAGAEKELCLFDGPI